MTPGGGGGDAAARRALQVVAFLASARSSYITGTTMLADGGLVRSVL